MHSFLIPLFFTIGLIVGILATYFVNRRSGKFSRQAELDAVRSEFMTYRSTAQDALTIAQDDLDELRSRYSMLQTKLQGFKAKLSEPPVSFSPEETTGNYKLPFLKDDLRNQDESDGFGQPTDYVR